MDYPNTKLFRFSDFVINELYFRTEAILENLDLFDLTPYPFVSLIHPPEHNEHYLNKQNEILVIKINQI